MPETKKNKEEDIQAWLDQVHYGSCCSDEPDTCKKEPAKAEKEDSSKESTNS